MRFLSTSLLGIQPEYLAARNQERETKKIEGTVKKDTQGSIGCQQNPESQLDKKRNARGGKNRRKNRRGIFARLLLLVLDEHKCSCAAVEEELNVSNREVCKEEVYKFCAF